MSEVYCPYCNTKAILEDTAKIYHGKSYGLAYICANFPRCDAYVGVHKGTDEPLGTMANKKLRQWRSAAHANIDPLWERGDLTRDEVYELMSMILKIPKEKCHIGMFNIEQCKKLIRRMGAHAL